MRLVSSKQLLDIEIEENKPAVLIIEDPDTMAEVVEDLYNLCQNEEGSFVLSEGLKELSFEKTAEIIINPFSIDFNSKRIQSRLYSSLLEFADEYMEEKSVLQRLIIEYLDKLTYHVPYDMIVSNVDMDVARLFKMFEVRLEPQCSTITERLAEYVKVLSRLMKKKLLILINICSYIDSEALTGVLTMCAYNKLQVLLIENIEQSFLIPVNTYIVDRDRCLIIK